MDQEGIVRHVFSSQVGVEKHVEEMLKALHCASQKYSVVAKTEVTILAEQLQATRRQNRVLPWNIIFGSIRALRKKAQKVL